MIREPGVPETAKECAAARAAEVAVPALFVNARFLTQDVTGVQRYAIELSRRLKTLHPNVRFLTPQGVKQREVAAGPGQGERRHPAHAVEAVEPRLADAPLRPGGLRHEPLEHEGERQGDDAEEHAGEADLD